MSRLVLPIVALVALVMGAVALDRPLPPADFTYVNKGEVATLDLAQATWLHDLRVARTIYEGLTRHDLFSPDYAPLPGVAERWTVSPDGRTYTFHLRADACWSNGDAVRAGDFVFAWRRLLLPDVAADYFKLATLVKGGQAMFDWRAAALKQFRSRTDVTDRRAEAARLWDKTVARFDATVGVHAADDRTLVVELERPTPYFLDLTGFPPFFPLYPPLLHSYESLDPATGVMKTDPDWTKPGTLISNGPFELASWRFKREMYFRKSQRYWDRGSIAIDTIRIPSIPDSGAQVIAFRTGAVQWTSDVGARYTPAILAERAAFEHEHADEVSRLRGRGLDPIAVARALPRDPRNTILTYPGFGTYFYNIFSGPKLADGRPNPLADARVRRALTMALDRAAIVDKIRRLGEPVATTYIPPGSIAGYQSPRGLPHDPDAARALLADAGYPGGQGLPTIEILFNKEGEHDLIAQSAARDWQRELGVAVALKQKELKAFREDLKTGNYMISRASWFGDYGDPTTFLDTNRSDDGNNDRKYASREYDALLDAARDEPDPARRLALLTRAEQKLVDEDCPLIPIFQYTQLYLFDPHALEGISPHPRQEQDLARVRVVKPGTTGPTRPKPDTRRETP